MARHGLRPGVSRGRTSKDAARMHKQHYQPLPTSPMMKRQPLPTSPREKAAPSQPPRGEGNEKANVLTTLLHNSLTSKRNGYCL